jgi:hypothetical protein
MCEVHVAEGMTARDEAFVIRVELTFDPVRPHPVAVALDGHCVQYASQMHFHSQLQEVSRNRCSLWISDPSRGFKQLDTLLSVVKPQSLAEQIQRAEKFHSLVCGQLSVIRCPDVSVK